MFDGKFMGQGLLLFPRKFPEIVLQQKGEAMEPMEYWIQPNGQKPQGPTGIEQAKSAASPRWSRVKSV